MTTLRADTVSRPGETAKGVSAKRDDSARHPPAKRTRKREFLDEMQSLVPWSELVSVVEPHAPRARTGRPPFAVEVMLRIHYLQQWFGLSDQSMEEALRDVPLYRQFARLPDDSRVPDESTILRFRHRLREHDLTADLLRRVSDNLQARGLVLRTGVAVDAALVCAPRSTKTAPAEHHPERTEENTSGARDSAAEPRSAEEDPAAREAMP